MGDIVITYHMGHALGVGLGGAGGQKLSFPHMKMWHIKLTGMSRTEGKLIFQSRVKQVTLGWGQISFNFKDFYTKHCVCNLIKDLGQS